MARLTRLYFARHGQRDFRLADLHHHFHHNYPPYRTVRIVLDQLDIHHELHYAVCIDRLVRMTSSQANYSQYAHPSGLCVSRLMDREIPISEYVRATASRTSAQRASNRPVPGHARHRLEARSGKLPGRVSERHKSVRVS